MDLFEDTATAPGTKEELGMDAVLLRGFAFAIGPELLAAAADVAAAAPFRNMITPGGFTMSVAMTNCGKVGWVSDRKGYRYEAIDPQTGQRWPAMPASFHGLALQAAAEAGFPGFDPDACLINRYGPGTRLTLHQDRDEKNLGAPIVSVSLGVPATFLFGGMVRSAPIRRVPLQHGDVAVWGGASRLAYHGIAPLRDETHPETGSYRINLTFRQTR